MKKVIMLLLLLTGCSTMHSRFYKERLSYQIGCVDRGNGSPADSYMCYVNSKRFEKELEQAVHN